MNPTAILFAAAERQIARLDSPMSGSITATDRDVRRLAEFVMDLLGQEPTGLVDVEQDVEGSGLGVAFYLAWMSPAHARRIAADILRAAHEAEGKP